MFKQLSKLVEARFKEMKKGTIHSVNLERNTLWDVYIESFSEDERQHHTCNCCKSFLANPDNKADDAAKKAEIMLEVLKRIIEVKQDENKAKREASSKREQLALMKELLGKKRIEGLEAMSADDIAKKIKELEG